MDIPSTSKGKKPVYRTDDPGFAEIVSKLLKQVEDEEDDKPEFDTVGDDCMTETEKEETISDPPPSSDDSDNDPNYSPALSELENEESYESDDTEEEIATQDAAEVHGNVVVVPDGTKIYFGKDGKQWSATEPSRRGRPSAHNILSIGKLPGVSRFGQDVLGVAPSEVEVWNQFFSPYIMEEILKYTNLHLSLVRARLGEKKMSYHKDLSMHELNAFFGVLVLTSITKSNRENIKSVFCADVSGRPIFRAAMSVNRFIAIKEAIRFDNPYTRAARRAQDPAAPISNIFSILIENCQKMYVPSEHCTVDETLLPFRGKSPFTVYMPKKPAKYGIKLINLTDAKTSYLYNSYIYKGKGSDGLTLSTEEKTLMVPTQSLLQVTKPIYHTNRNVTADNYFSSIQATEELRKRGLTYVGTLKKNKREIPPEFLVVGRQRVLYDTIYGYSNGITLLSQKVKNNRVVLLVSSMHNSSGIDEKTGKPEMIAFYNKTKGGVDTLDFCCSVYSPQRKDVRWPLCVLSGMIAITLVNSFIVHQCFQANDLQKRNTFIKKLAIQLMRPSMLERIQNPRVSNEVKELIKKSLALLNSSFDDLQISVNEGTTDTDGLTPSDKLEKRKNCSLCCYKKNRKTNCMCISCKHPICLECSRKLCINCVKKL